MSNNDSYTLVIAEKPSVAGHSVKKQRCHRVGDTSAAGENVEACISDTACGVAEQSKAGEYVESSRVVPVEHLCAVKVWRSAKRYRLRCR